MAKSNYKGREQTSAIASTMHKENQQSGHNTKLEVMVEECAMSIKDVAPVCIVGSRDIYIFHGTIKEDNCSQQNGFYLSWSLLFLC